MTDIYQPPPVWRQTEPSGGVFAGINRAAAGAQFKGELPVGLHPFQLYSMATPNGTKVAIFLEELRELGIKDASYDAHLIDIFDGDQFSTGFVGINPNSKIPALVDRSTAEPTAVFESGAILLYIAEKFDRFLPHGPSRTACLSWLFWQVGSAPYLGGGFGHFFAYAPNKMRYPIDRYTMEVKRQLSVLDAQLAEHPFICGDEYTIADMAIWPWYGSVVLNRMYSAADFLDVQTYPNVLRWARAVAVRPAVDRATHVLEMPA